MTLDEFREKYQPADNMFWKEACESQLGFISLRIEYLLDKEPVIIATHASKSIVLPVYQFNLDCVVITLRNNFYDWKVSVNSPSVDIDVITDGLFDPEEEIDSMFCEGFPEELVYGPYSKNKKQFTIEIHNDYYLFVFLFMLRGSIK